MNNRKNFTEYLKDLSTLGETPGGGSALCLIFCLGASLIKKSITCSLLPKNSFLTSAKAEKLKAAFLEFDRLSKKIFPGIDLDTELFGKVVKSRGTLRFAALARSQGLTLGLALSAENAFCLAVKTEKLIHKSIVVDFSIAKDCFKVVMKGCLLNFDFNSQAFGKSSAKDRAIRRKVGKWVL